MRRIGFSTGAIAKGDFRGALEVLIQHGVEVVELSALRIQELQPLVRALPELPLSTFSFVSIHAPSRFPPESEAIVIEELARVDASAVVVHPDVVYRPEKWEILGDRLLIENMDKRKPIGRTVVELADLFERLPEARFCFDIGHARQVDPSMTEAAMLLRAYGERLAEVHLSEVNTASRHDPLSANAVRAFRPLLTRIPERVPVILESLIHAGQSDVRTEMARAAEILTGCPQPRTVETAMA